MICPFKDNVGFTRCCPDEYIYNLDGNILTARLARGYYRERCDRKDCLFFSDNSPVWEFPDFDKIDTTKWCEPEGFGDYTDWFCEVGAYKKH